MRLLVVEDQRKMAGFIQKGLTELGYTVDVAQSAGGADALLSEHEYDLILLDVMLPDTTGFDLCRELRNQGVASPVLLLTALTSTKDKVSGLDSGADDFLSKPFAFEELAARVRALLRRGKQAHATPVLRYEDLEMNLVNRKVIRAEQEIKLTTKEFALLEYFMRNTEKPLSRTQIAEHVWDLHFDSESNVIDVYVNMKRKKIDQGFTEKLLHTVIGFGYVFKKE